MALQRGRPTELSTYGAVLAVLKDAARVKRAQQLFSYCAVNRIPVTQPSLIEKEFHRCVKAFARLAITPTTPGDVEGRTLSATPGSSNDVEGGAEVRA